MTRSVTLPQRKAIALALPVPNKHLVAFRVPTGIADIFHRLGVNDDQRRPLRFFSRAAKLTGEAGFPGKLSKLEGLDGISVV